MKFFKSFSLIGAAAMLAAGCATSPQANTIGPLVVQEGVATGVGYAALKYTNAVPYLRAADDVICAAANGTNLAPADVIAAIDASPSASAVKTPEGALILNSALTLYVGIWESYGSNAISASTNLQPYLQATCNGITQGLPPTSPAAASLRRITPPGRWPLVRFP